MATNGVQMGRVPEFHGMGHTDRDSGTSEMRHTEMKASVSGGGTTEITDVLDQLAKTSESDSQLKGDVKDFLLQRGGSGTYTVKGEESTFVFVKFDDGSVFEKKLEGTLQDAQDSLRTAHESAGPGIAQKQREAGTPTRVQARIENAVRNASSEKSPESAVQGVKTADLASSSSNASKPSQSFWAMMWGKVSAAASETKAFFSGVETRAAAVLSGALSQVNSKREKAKPNQDVANLPIPLGCSTPGKTPVSLLRHGPFETLHTTTTTRVTTSNDSGTRFAQALEGQPRINFREASYKGRMYQLQNGLTGAMAALGAKSDGPITDYHVKRGMPTTLPHISNLDSLDDTQEYVLLSDDAGNKAVFSGAEIKQMAKTATAWSVGERGQTFTDPGLSTGLTKDNLIPMMKAVTWSEVPRPMADQNGNVIPRNAGVPAPAHFICNVSAPDLTLPDIISAYTGDDGKIDVSKIKSEFIDHAVCEFVDQCLESGVEQITIPAVGLGAFGFHLQPEQKTQYAQAIMEAAVNRIRDRDTNGQIQVIAFSGSEFGVVDKNFIDSMNVSDHLSLVLTNNETTSCEIAAGNAGLVSATLNAGDQNKLPGCHAFDGVKKVLDGGTPYINHVAQDEAQQLKNPLFAILQSPVFNSYFREQLQSGS